MRGRGAATEDLLAGVHAMDDLLIAAPLRTEALVLRSARARARVARTGMGPARARLAGARLAQRPGSALAVMGFCGAVAPTLHPGDLVVASELRGPDGEVVQCAGAALLAAALARAGLSASCGPIACTRRIVRGAQEREQLRAQGVLAVDMESIWLVPGAGERPFAVVRAVVDAPGRELRRARATVTGALAAAASLRRAAPVLAGWAGAVRPRNVLLASPRSACAGVDRAIDVVEAVLEQRGSPLYVRRQIVHNTHVVRELEQRGVVFVQELDEVPDGATVVFSAHGVAPAVREQAAMRELDVVDATCPLVSKVHAEARRFAAAGRTILLIGHAGHDEVEGVLGEAPAAIHLVEDLSDVDGLEIADPGRVAYLTQTTLAVDETAGVVQELRERFPGIAGPRSQDICYATQNRQDAVRAIAGECERMIVVGSENSSNSNRLVEVARRAGCDARLVEDESRIDLDWVAAAQTIGVTGGASVRDALVARVVAALALLGPLSVDERAITQENVHFRLLPGLSKGSDNNNGRRTSTGD